MKKQLAIVGLTCLFLSCSRVPITGRHQVNMLPENLLVGMSITNYQTFLSKHPAASPTVADAQLVKTVGQRMATAVSIYMRQQGKSKRIKDYKWEYNLVNDPTVNAWCMPGGKVVVYSGIMPLTKGEAGLAVVMGHEIAHAIARHGNERMSQMLLVNIGAVGLAVAMVDKPQETNDIYNAAYGVGSTLGILAYSRMHESEADKLGLVFMAMAGYNPEEAVGFWQRMAQKGGPKPPEWLSTHPSDETRIKAIQQFLPTAKKYYKPRV